MRLSCLQENLSQGLHVVGRAVATRTTLPITQHVLVSTDEGRLKLSATNLEIAISTWVGAQIEEEGSITIPERLLADFVSSLPKAAIDVSTTEQGRAVELKSGRGEAHINGGDPNEFPPIPSVGEGTVAKVAPNVLREAIHQVVFAAAVEDSRPVLTGISVELDGDKMVLAAADGFRLAVHTAALLEPVSEALTVIIPGRTLQEVERLVEGQQSPVEMVITPQKSQVLFKMENIEMVSQLIQGTFPNYSQLIPQGHTTRAVVGLQDLLRTTRTAAIFAKDGSGIIRVQVVPGAGKDTSKLIVSARAEEVGDNTGDLEAEVEGEEGKIAFNSKYLADVLSVLDKDQVAVEMTTSSSPGVIRPVGVENYIHVVMPMFVQW